MVLDKLLELTLAVFAGLLAMFPDWTPPFTVTGTGVEGVAVIGDYVRSLGQIVRVIDAFVNVVLLVDVITAVVAWWTGLMIARVGLFVYDRLPFKAT